MARKPGDGPEVEAALLRRAQTATDAAARESQLVARCAWCGRYRSADRWMVTADVSDLGEFTDVTHTICDDCAAQLRAAGLSA